MSSNVPVAQATSDEAVLPERVQEALGQLVGAAKEGLLSLSVAADYNGVDFNGSGGYTPPDTNGAAGPSAYVETVNQAVRLFPNKTIGIMNSGYWNCDGVGDCSAQEYHHPLMYRWTDNVVASRTRVGCRRTRGRA